MHAYVKKETNMNSSIKGSLKLKFNLSMKKPDKYLVIANDLAILIKYL